ncbi:MAG: preprotein translocase subunit SecE [Armatimonadetes bacterium]|jgi:preprotein translocase subunit SecE|nr:preprotein translocase subunit SecE [Armatimonadota bacterium]MDI9585345.1 preprotein translocase subunit SecE [Acidobacteriota bacterium]
MATPKPAKAPLLSRIANPFRNLWRFLRDVYSELQRVVWPSHEETYSFTVVIILAITIVAVWVGVLDLFFTTLMSILGISK